MDSLTHTNSRISVGRDDGPSVLERMGLNGSLSHGDEKGRKAWVRERSGLVAGGDVDVKVGGHTQLDGAVIASTGAT